MSSFSNGGYVPSGMDFADWVEYLDAKRDALIDEELEEFYNELFEPEQKEEEKFKLSLPEEHLSFLKHETDKFIDGVKESLSGMTKSGKLEALAEMQRETRERLLFNFIRDNKDEVFYSVLRSPSNSFLEEERKSQSEPKRHLTNAVLTWNDRLAYRCPISKITFFASEKPFSGSREASKMCVKFPPRTCSQVLTQ